MKTRFAPSLVLRDEVENRLSRSRPRTKYKLPPIKKESIFSVFRRSKIKQQSTDASERKNSDVINFL